MEDNKTVDNTDMLSALTDNSVCAIKKSAIVSKQSEENAECILHSDEKFISAKIVEDKKLSLKSGVAINAHPATTKTMNCVVTKMENFNKRSSPDNYESSKSTTTKAEECNVVDAEQKQELSGVDNKPTIEPNKCEINFPTESPSPTIQIDASATIKTISCNFAKMEISEEKSPYQHESSMEKGETSSLAITTADENDTEQKHQKPSEFFIGKFDVNLIQKSAIATDHTLSKIEKKVNTDLHNTDSSVKVHLEASKRNSIDIPQVLWEASQIEKNVSQVCHQTKQIMEQITEEKKTLHTQARTVESCNIAHSASSGKTKTKTDISQSSPDHNESFNIITTEECKRNIVDYTKKQEISANELEYTIGPEKGDLNLPAKSIMTNFQMCRSFFGESSPNDHKSSKEKVKGETSITTTTAREGNVEHDTEQKQEISANELEYTIGTERGDLNSPIKATTSAMHMCKTFFAQTSPPNHHESSIEKVKSVTSITTTTGDEDNIVHDTEQKQEKCGGKFKVNLLKKQISKQNVIEKTESDIPKGLSKVAKQPNSSVLGLEEKVLLIRHKTAQLLEKLRETKKTLRTHDETLQNDESQSDTIKRSNLSDADVPSSSSNGKSKRRNRGKKKKSKQNTKDSSKNKLSNYINSIVSAHLQGEELKCAEFEYKENEDLEEYAQRCVRAGIGKIVESEIYVNRKNSHQAFVRLSDSDQDAIIQTRIARQYTFDGDVVQVFVLSVPVSASTNDQMTETDESKTVQIECEDNNDSLSIANADSVAAEEDEIVIDDLDVTAVTLSSERSMGFVIKVVTQTDNRQFVGTITFQIFSEFGNKKFYKLKPHDMRVPVIHIPTEACETLISQENKDEICGFLFVAKVNEIDNEGRYIGELTHPVGKCGNIEAEIKAILLHNGLRDVQPFEERFNEMFNNPLTITAADLEHREDLRKKCIFTIDPITAKDLDDAMSCDVLPDGNFEIGVHISDVSHFLTEDSELDNLVKTRATSIYLVNEVIHMLPKPLCFKCSLLPGEDKFTCSVFWSMDADGNVLTTRYARTVINSCSQFAYEHAQKIIDYPNEEYTDDDFPPICNGFTIGDILKRVQVLNSIAQKMRSRRYDNGALSINNPKLRFILDPLTGEPSEYEIESRQEANFLIEEFMLLANQSVAQLTYDKFPNISFLRSHSPPVANAVRNLKKKLSALGITIDMTSSKTIRTSMQRIITDSTNPESMEAFLNFSMTKPMSRARYFCSEGIKSEDPLWHYSLSVPIYTHFTSPIRRYPDIIVHRLVVAALGYTSQPKRSAEELHSMAKTCNDQKLNAKNAGDESIELFFKRYINLKRITLRAVVSDIFRHVMQVITIETGHLVTIQYNLQNVAVNTSQAPAFIYISEKGSTKQRLMVKVLSTIDIILTVCDGVLTGFLVSPDVDQREINNISAATRRKQHGFAKNMNPAGITKNEANSTLPSKEEKKKNSKYHKKLDKIRRFYLKKEGKKSNVVDSS